MGFISSGLFWGVVVILLGISIILNVIFNVHIPLFRIIIALFIIYFGISILMGGFPKHNDRDNVIFNETRIKSTGGDAKYNIVFGRGDIDLSGVELKDENIKIKINTVFAGGVIKLNPDIPAEIKVETAFGGVRMPDGNRVAFGNCSYKTKNFKSGEKHLEIEAHVVFGELEITE